MCLAANFMKANKKIGVLAFHGSVIEHIRAIENCGAKAVEVKTKEQLAKVDALIIPGGESTTLGKLLAREELDKEIVRRTKKSMPVYGTCAGAILLAKRVISNNQETLGLIDIDIERNGYGRQLDSFETDIKMGTKNIKATFIRAPKILRTGKGVECLARYKNSCVLARQGKVIVSTFHPELDDGLFIHRYFLSTISNEKL